MWSKCYHCVTWSLLQTVSHEILPLEGKIQVLKGRVNIELGGGGGKGGKIEGCSM